MVRRDRRVLFCSVRIGTISRNGFLICFILVGRSFPTLLSSLSLAADSVENILQNPFTKSFSGLVMLSDFARNHSDVNREFLPVIYCGSPNRIPGAVDNPVSFHGGTHSGF